MGDDICWMKFGPDSLLFTAINPEAGFFGGSAGHQQPHQPQCHAHPGRQRHLHQHRAGRRRRGGEGMSRRPPAGAYVVEGRGVDPGVGNAAALAPGSPFPPPDPAIASESGGPGRGAHRRHPVRWPTGLGIATPGLPVEGWEHGVFLGSIMASRRPLRRQPGPSGTCGGPFAMLPFCGYNMADYFASGCPSGPPPTRRNSRRRSSTSTGSARTPTDAGCGPATRRTPGSSNGSSSGSAGRARPPRRRSKISHPGRRGHRHRRARRLRRRTWRSCSTSTSTSGGPRVPSIRQHLAKFGDKLPAQLAAEVDRSRATAGLTAGRANRSGTAAEHHAATRTAPRARTTGTSAQGTGQSAVRTGRGPLGLPWTARRELM